MSDSENTKTSVSYELLICSDPMALLFPSRRGADRVYGELLELSKSLPARYGDLFRHRWGLDSHFPHMTEQTATRFGIPKNTVQRMLNQSLWNIARYAHYCELPAIRELLGDDQTRWAERAWNQADQRWGNQYAAFSEAVLLLAVGGIPVRDAHAVARQRMIEVGVARTNRWGKPLNAQEKLDDARIALDRILQQVIWPSNPAHNEDMGGFSNQRPLPSFACSKTGVFRSEKLQRLVQFDSTLELRLLEQFELDDRVASYQEQPVELNYTLDGETRGYTPDIAVQLVDGRAFIVEAKPLDHLGEYTNVLKWASMARWCSEHGLGWWVGSPQRSLADHRGVQPDPDKLELVVAEVNAGPVIGGDYEALMRLVGYEQLGLVATKELLEWRPGMGQVRRPRAAGRKQLESFWCLVRGDAEPPWTLRDREHPLPTPRSS